MLGLKIPPMVTLCVLLFKNFFNRRIRRTGESEGLRTMSSDL
jgi:hypothetical protein